MQTRRQFLGSVAAGVASLPLWAQAPPDFALRIEPVTLDLGPKKSFKTIGYNGSAPGPLLRVKEGQRFTVDVENRTRTPEIVHWHGLLGSPAMDGAMEEGSPMIAPGGQLRYELEAKPAGLRWYHTHTFAGTDTSKGQYTGQHGVLWMQPAQDAGRYDAEAFVVLQDWGARMAGGGDGSMNPEYEVSTINGKMLGAGEPLRVREGDRVMLHVLNSSATEVHWISLTGHVFEVVALDGNVLPKQQSVAMLRLAPAERVSAVVVMSNPGVWVLGEVRRHIQAAGMGLVVEYAGASGAPTWVQPLRLRWDYADFGSATTVDDAMLHEIPLVFQSKFQGHGAMETWTINGKSYPDVPSPKLVAGERYRLRLQNRSKDDHPIHLHRHRFELAQMPGTPVMPRGIVKDTVLVEANTEVCVDFTADNPGDTLLHCHQQDHMDRGFMMVLKYA
jgi:FtsP/CotA-like multicopper oxidase with cupredoxin domain